MYTKSTQDSKPLIKVRKISNDWYSTQKLDYQNSDIYQNLAVDEALAKTYLENENTLNTLRFWKSDKAVVIGRFQCVHKEVNLSYCAENGIAIARRFTGGDSLSEARDE